ncbi:hypothetical protein V2I01_36740 [Micromonospora sp. BRA006-A]|nr:hypothetical protein [Micromonospora sp. BRA006-A]
MHRGQLLDGPVKAAIAQRKVGRADIVRITAEAAVTDLRGQQVLGELLRVLDSTPVTDPALAAAVTKLRAWQQAGSRRVGTTRLEGLPARRGHPDLRRLVAAAHLGTVPSRPRPRPVRRPRRRPPGQRGALGRPERRPRRHRELGGAGPGAQGLGVPVRLVGLRRQGPAGRARRPGRRRARAHVLRQRQPGRVPAGAAGHARPGRRGAGDHRLPGDSRAGRATSGAPTRSPSPGSAASPPR